MKLEILLALTIWSEDSGEQFKGRQAVASVIYERAMGDSVKTGMMTGHYQPCLISVCLSRKQFSCWNSGRLWKRESNLPTGKSWDESLALATALVDGTFKPTVKATHYHGRKVKPRWARAYRYVCRVGNHLFYRAA